MIKAPRWFTSVILLAMCFILGMAPGIDGRWTTSIPGPNGDMQLVFTFKASGDSLTGTVASAMGTLPISDGKIEGNKISFNVDINGTVIAHKGTISGDVIHLEAQGMQGRDFKMVLKRAPIQEKTAKKRNN